MRLQDPHKRIKNFKEVELGYSEKEATEEVKRCLNCKSPSCVIGCPVNIDIPGFIQAIQNKDTDLALEIIMRYNNLPGICGRVCPQENQCQKVCVLNKRGDPISIGRLERYASDNGKIKIGKIKKNKKKVAIVGSGPSSLTCAADLAKLGYDITIFEALQKGGGVLTFGIPNFRLPNTIIEKEIKVIEDLGVKIEYNTVIGKTITLDELKEKYSAIFLGVGAGLPNFMKIPGENLNGVMSANEFLTRINLMNANNKDYDTPIGKGERTIVVGGGNVAMDAARSARRLGSDVTIVYRRSFEEMPARLDEIHHAKEEGIKFMILTNPVAILGDNSVTGIRCVQMKLDEPDESGRRKPIPMINSDFTMNCDQVLVAIGTTPNPLLVKESGLKHSIKGAILVNESTQTSDPQIYAGGDIIGGNATVIQAMGEGKVAARSIHNKLSE